MSGGAVRRWVRNVVLAWTAFEGGRSLYVLQQVIAGWLR